MKKLITLLTMLIVAISTSWAATDSYNVTEWSSGTGSKSFTMAGGAITVNAYIQSKTYNSAGNTIVAFVDGSNMLKFTATSACINSITLTGNTDDNSNTKKIKYATSADGTTWGAYITLDETFSNRKSTPVARTISFAEPVQYVRFLRAESNSISIGNIAIDYNTGGSSKTASECAFATAEPAINFPGTATYKQIATTAAGYDGTVTYSLSNNTCGASIDDTHEVTVTQEGSVTVTATAPATDNYSASSASYTLTVADTRTALTAAWSKGASFFEVNSSATIPTFDVSGGTIGTAYSVEYTKVSGDDLATLGEGGISAINTSAVGTETIKATVTVLNTEDYKMATTEYDCVIIVANSFFSMKNITAIVNDSEDTKKGTVTAEISDGSSVDVYNGKGNASDMYYYSSINLNASSGNYIHVTFPTSLQAGDVILATFLGGDNAWKLSKTTSGAASKTNPYTIAANDALLGATELYIFKDGSAQVSELIIAGEGKVSDLAVTSSTTPVVAIGAESTIEYTTSSTGAITFASSNESVATVSSAGVITAVDGGTATITISQDADETYRAGEATVTVTVPERAIIRLTLPGGTNTGDAPGTIGGSYDGKTQGRNTTYGGCKLGGTGQYIGITLATGNSFQEGDIVEVKFVGEEPMTGDDSKVIFYDSKEQTNVIYNTETSPALGTYRYILPEGANGQTSLYLVRGENKNSKFNPFIDYIAVYRPNATVSLNAKGFATYSKATDFEFAGAKAYKMALNENEKTITGTEVTGKIAAGEGILLKGKAGAKVSIIETTGATALEGNSLKGTTTASGDKASVPTYCYTLSGDTFKNFKGATFNDNKAYLESTQDLSGQSFEIIFDDQPTAINFVVEDDANVAVAPVKTIKNGQLFIGNYNVAGQLVK